MAFIIQKHGKTYNKCKNIQSVIEIIDTFDDYREEDEVNENFISNVKGSIF